MQDASHDNKNLSGTSLLVKQMGFYHHQHTQGITKLTHFIGVPLIIFALLCFLITFLPIWVTLVGIVVLCCYYLYLDKLIGSLTSLVLILTTWLSWLTIQHFSLWLIGTLFIIGWILQLLGHLYERSKPAFFSNLTQVFVAPIFLVAEICFFFGIKKDIQRQIIH